MQNKLVEQINLVYRSKIIKVNKKMKIITQMRNMLNMKNDRKIQLI